MKHNSNKTDKAKKQTGAVAIEFALMFPVFFALVYAIIAYGMYFLVQLNLTYASEEVLRATIGSCVVEDGGPCRDEGAWELGIQNNIDNLVKSDSPRSLLVLRPSNLGIPNPDYCEPYGTSVLCRVEITADPIINGITLPGIGKVPDLPQLRGKASLVF